ncbi:hypothetical protein SAMN02983003_0157 [Devosia enhydra]|uniref:Uncharacterized protein n=1 Tax=Devosia enhydra TaxID=665118 RepID=A0A1K2HSM6_9HYPH|nr:hypothetical protein [Devosia enhydra]SFZ80828.1 hypothetical protein SAMN02983003_0157 [Devosia enhydra]
MNIKTVPNQTDIDIEASQTLVDFDRAARELAANVLRLVAGGGRAHGLSENVDNLYDAIDRYHKVHHAYPSQHQWNQALNVNAAWFELNSRGIDESLSPENMDERQRLAFDRAIAISGIRDGMLQMAASMLMHQIPQQAAGEAKFYENFHHLIDLQERSRDHHHRLPRQRGENDGGQAKLRRALEGSNNARPKKRKAPAKPNLDT